jgi:hypothetical protein
LPNVADANAIRAFLSGTTCESLVHELGCKSPRTTKELLDIATSHASGEEAVGATFYHAKGKVKRDKSTSGGASNRPGEEEEQEEQRGFPHGRSRPKGW